MTTHTYTVTIHDVGNICNKARNIHTILTSKDNIQPRERVEVVEAANPDEYNGWVNRETCAAAPHLSNDEWLYKTCGRIVRQADADAAEFYESNRFDMPALKDTNLAAERIEQFATEAFDEVLHVGPGEEWARLMLSDVGSCWRVDWHAVADSLREDD